MTNRQGKNDRLSVHAAQDFLQKGRKRLSARELRPLIEQIRGLPEGAGLPDYSNLTINERFAIALRFVAQELREKLLGKSGEQIRRYEKTADIPLSVVAALSAETEFPLQWIVDGRPSGRAGLREDSPQYSEELVQKLAFRASAGDGGQLAIDEEAELVPFPRTILDHTGVRPENARLLQASGESMVPTINDGDLLLVDVSDRTIAEGKVYTFSIGEDVFVKRLRKSGGKVLIRSDNRDLFPTEEAVPEDLPFRVYGRVRWAGRNL